MSTHELNTPNGMADTDTGAPAPVPALTQDALRTLAGLLLLNLQTHGAPGLWINVDDQPSDCTMARIDISETTRRRNAPHWPYALVIADFAGDHARSITRHVDVYVAKSGAGPFALDPTRRLVVFRAQDFSLPPRWSVELYRDPTAWFGWTVLLLQQSVRSVLDRGRSTASS
jgi:hypothetical protein